MRRGLLVDSRGQVRAAAAPEFPEGVVYVALARCGAELVFHKGRVRLPALMQALRLLASCRPRRIALRLLPEGDAPVRIIGFPDLARHLETLALPAPASRAAKARKLALESRLSLL
jgi:hypothetical protein